MKTIFKSDFECIYTINGETFEGGSTYLEENCVYYVTVFPLSAIYLPYTIKLVGNKVFTNKDLCVLIKNENERYLLFSKRYSYLYAPTPYTEESGIVGSFFSCIKQNRIDKARSYLNRELDKSVSDDALCGFFDKYEYVIKTDEKDKWILADTDGNGKTFTFAINNGLIEDISN